MSNAALILCTIGIISSQLLLRYFTSKKSWFIIIIELISIVLFLISEITIFALKRNNETGETMRRNSIWRRFVFYQKLIAWFFVLNLIFIVVKNEFHLKAPSVIQGYLFFLSLGMLFGFEISRYEYTRSLKKRNNSSSGINMN